MSTTSRDRSPLGMLDGRVQDHQTPIASMQPCDRPHAGDVQLDEIETACPACTLEWRAGVFRHDRACVFR